MSSFVFSLQYLCYKKKHRINQLIIGISESVQDLILCRCVCGYCNVLCTRNVNLIELFHRPHRVPQSIFPQLLNKSTFAWLLHVVVLLYTRNLYFIASFKGPPKHKVILVIWFLRRSLEMTPISVLCIGYLLAGLSATASQGH